MDYENLSLKELQDKLVEFGMPQEDVSAFKSKAPIISTLKAMSAQQAVLSEEIEEEAEEEAKVATLEERPNPNEEKETNRRWKTKAERMKSILLAEPQVSILVPLDAGERVGKVEWREDARGDKFQVHISGNIETVQLNGYRYFIPKGVYTPVPQSIAEVIAQSQQQTLNAGSNISLNRIDPVTGRPFNEIL
jgi:hypothetical protein